MPPKGWKILSIKEETFNRIKAYIEERKRRASIAGFVDEAVNEKLERLKEEAKADG
jgi:nitrogen regulatory protein PII-like uncharacterized protein